MLHGVQCLTEAAQQKLPGQSGSKRFTSTIATKSMETRNKILALVNSKNSGKRSYLIKA